MSSYIHYPVYIQGSAPNQAPGSELMKKRGLILLVSLAMFIATAPHWVLLAGPVMNNGPIGHQVGDVGGTLSHQPVYFGYFRVVSEKKV